MAYRILLLLPNLYRRWAMLRLRDLRPWVETWSVPEMFAGIPGKGAEDAWWHLALRLECVGAEHQGFADPVLAPVASH